MDNTTRQKGNMLQAEEKIVKGGSGMRALVLNTLLIAAGIVLFVFSIIWIETDMLGIGIAALVLSSLFSFIIGPILYCGLKVLKPNEALVLTLFGRYYGTLKGEGFYYVNPFCTAVNPAWDSSMYNVALEKMASTTGKAENEQYAGLMRNGKKNEPKVYDAGQWTAKNKR